MARHAPGLSPTELKRMTREETNVIRDSIGRMLKAEGEERIEHTKALVKAAGARLVV